MERLEPHGEGPPEICRGSSSSLQLSSDQHMHKRKIPEVEKEPLKGLEGTISSALAMMV